MARCVLVLLDVAGDIHGLSTDGNAYEVTTWDDRVLGFVPLAEVTELPTRSAPVFGTSYAGSSGIGITITGIAEDLYSRRRQNPIQLAQATIYWWEPGTVLKPQDELYAGVLREPVFDLVEDGGVLTAQIVPLDTSHVAIFPPTVIGDDGRFPNAPTTGKSSAVPVIFGTVRGVPFYSISLEATDPQRLVLAGHDLVSTTVDIAHDNDQVLVNKPVLYARDGRGDIYAYVELAKAAFDAYPNVYALEVQGFPGPNGRPLAALGDVLEHLMRTYGQGLWYQLDRKRVEAARVHLNRIEVGFFVNEAGVPINQFVEGRFAGQFPIAFGIVGGRYGWDSLLFPLDRNRAYVDEIVDGQNAFGFAPPRETSADDLIGIVELEYGLDGASGSQLASRRLDASNSPVARRVRERWGEKPIERISLPDVPDPGIAYSLGTDLLAKRGWVRERIEIEEVDERFWRYPLLSLIRTTSSQFGIEAEPYLLEVVQPNEDGSCRVVLVSYEGL